MRAFYSPYPHRPDDEETAIAAMLSPVAGVASSLIAGVAARRAAAHERRQKAALLRLLHTGQLAGGAAMLLKEITSAAYDLLLCERISVYICDRENNELWLAVCEDNLEGMVLPMGGGIAGSVAATVRMFSDLK